MSGEEEVPTGVFVTPESGETREGEATSGPEETRVAVPEGGRETGPGGSTTQPRGTPMRSLSFLTFSGITAPDSLRVSFRGRYGPIDGRH